MEESAVVSVETVPAISEVRAWLFALSVSASIEWSSLSSVVVPIQLIPNSSTSIGTTAPEAASSSTTAEAVVAEVRRLSIPKAARLTSTKSSVCEPSVRKSRSRSVGCGED